MALNIQDDLLEYYRRELAYLRTQSADFAARYPKVAQRLALTGSESTDPHTERLIEAVGFLTARVHRDLDREFPTVAAGLLDNLCPSLTQPVPAMTVVQMTLDPTQGKVTAGSRVPRATALQAVASSGETCRLRTTWDLTLWPLRLAGLRLEDPRTLRLDIACEGGADVAELELAVVQERGLAWAAARRFDHGYKHRARHGDRWRAVRSDRGHGRHRLEILARSDGQSCAYRNLEHVAA